MSQVLYNRNSKTLAESLNTCYVLYEESHKVKLTPNAVLLKNDQKGLGIYERSQQSIPPYSTLHCSKSIINTHNHEAVKT